MGRVRRLSIEAKRALEAFAFARASGASHASAINAAADVSGLARTYVAKRLLYVPAARAYLEALPSLAASQRVLRHVAVAQEEAA